MRFNFIINFTSSPDKKEIVLGVSLNSNPTLDFPTIVYPYPRN
jgi:hypothetical protein